MDRSKRPHSQALGDGAHGAAVSCECRKLPSLIQTDFVHGPAANLEVNSLHFLLSFLSNIPKKFY